MTTTKGDPTTTGVAEVEGVAGNGTDYNCDVSTKAASTDCSDTESTTSADSDRLHSPTFPIADNGVDLINPLPADGTHYMYPFRGGYRRHATSSASTTMSLYNRWT